MGVFKILAGVAIGVGAVAAAPFTGGGSIVGAATLAGSLAGTATVAGAAAAGAAGAAAGYAASKKGSNDKEKARNEAREEGVKAGEYLASKQYEEKLKAAEQALENFRIEASKVQKDTQGYEKLCKQIVAMFGIGLAVAYCDGDYSDVEQEEIQAFIAGISASAYPEETIRALHELESNPPNFEQAVWQAQREGVTEKVINAIISAVVYADDVMKPAEQELVTKWKQLSSYQH